MLQVTGSDSCLDAHPSRFWEPHWYAAYTCPRHEKKVAEQLRLSGLEFYLPLYSALHRWSDRRVELQLPLFPGYVFVRIPLSDKMKVLSLSGLVRLVGFGGHPHPLPDREVEALRNSLAVRSAQPHPYLAAGKKVGIKFGPLKGLEGVVVRRKSKWRVIVSVASISQSIAVELELADLQYLS